MKRKIERGKKALNRAKKSGGKTGLIIAVIVASVLGAVIAGWQFYIFKNPTTILKKENIENIEEMDEFGDAFKEAAEEMEAPDDDTSDTE